MVVFTAAIVALFTGATVGLPAGGVALALSHVIFVKKKIKSTSSSGRSRGSNSTSSSCSTSSPPPVNDDEE